MRRIEIVVRATKAEDGDVSQGAQRHHQAWRQNCAAARFASLVIGRIEEYLAPRQPTRPLFAARTAAVAQASKASKVGVRVLACEEHNLVAELTRRARHLRCSLRAVTARVVFSSMPRLLQVAGDVQARVDREGGRESVLVRSGSAARHEAGRVASGVLRSATRFGAVEVGLATISNSSGTGRACRSFTCTAS